MNSKATCIVLAVFIALISLAVVIVVIFLVIYLVKGKTAKTISTSSAKTPRDGDAFETENEMVKI